MGTDPELVVLVILAATLAVLAVSRRTRVPYPVLLVLAGLLVGPLPGMPELHLDPKVVLLGVLPPLLFWPAFLASPRELAINARPIAALAIALVLATTAAVAAFAHLVIGVPWDVGFVLGATVAATDPVAATATLRRLGAPRRVVVILEGESLVNDAAALVAYTVAVEAVVTGRFSLGEAALRFVLGGVAGIAIGLAAGRAMAWALQRMEDPLLAITLVLFGAYFAYLPAELVGASAVLAAVAAGLYLGWLDPRADRPHIRIAGYAFWDELVFLLNALVFLVIGLELPVILDGVQGFSATDLALWALAVPGVAIVLRILWVYGVLWAPERLERRHGTGQWRECGLKAWAGMRGVVSLAAALALPLSTDAGAPFPHRDLVIFLAYATVVSTLVVHGMTLPVVMRLLHVRGQDDDAERAVAVATAADAALRRADELDDEPWVPPECLSDLRRVYARRRRRFGARAGGAPDRGVERDAEACGRVRRELLDAERQALVDLRDRGVVSEDVHQDIQHDLDLAHLRTED